MYILRIPSFSGRPSEFTQGGFKAGPGSSCDLSICSEKEMWSCLPGVTRFLGYLLPGRALRVVYESYR